MIGNTLAIVLPLAALVIAGLAIAGIWYWWTTSSSADDGLSTGDIEQIAPFQDEIADYTGLGDELSGSFFSRLADSFRSWKAETPSLSATTSTSSASSPPLSGSTPPRIPAPVGDTVEVMRILRDLADGSLLVEIDGQRYKRLADIADAQVGRRFIGNAQALAHFAHLDDVKVPDEWGELPGAAEARVTSPPPSEAVRQSPPRAFPSSREQNTASSSKPVSSEEAEGPALSMVEQIEELLQFRLTATPDLAQRSIHVRSALDGGVRIEVDGRYFEGVGEVPDDRVREFIQSIIREWEARQ